MSESQEDRLERKVDEILHMLNGNGSPGLKTRIDRLERLANGGAWVFGLVGGPMLIGMFVLVVNWIRSELKAHP